MGFWPGSGGSGGGGGALPANAKGNLINDGAGGLTWVPYSTLTPVSSGNVDGGSGDTTNRFTAQTWQQSGGAQPYGDLYRAENMHGRAKGGIKFYNNGSSGTVDSVNNETYAITAGMTLTIVIDGGATQTVTFASSIPAATADQVTTLITAVIGVGAQTGQAWVNYVGNARGIRMSSDSFGTGSSIQVTGGTANAVLGFPTTVFTGAVGTIDLGNGLRGTPKAWIVMHDKPNDYTSNNKHQHISIEVPDSTGAFQTRIGIEYDLDISRITVSSAQFICNGNAIIVSNDPTSPKEYWFAKDNSGQQQSRLWLYRVNGDAAGDWALISVDDGGVTQSLLKGSRLGKYIYMNSSIQEKKGSDVARSTTLSPLAATGNSFTVAGTGTATYMKIDTWQTGSVITLELPTGVVLAHNGGSPSPGVSQPFFLSEQVNYTVSTAGATMTFWNNGTYWKQINPATDYLYGTATNHLRGTTAAPTIAAGTGAGTTPTVSVTNATDMSGIVNVTTGTTPTAAATVATMTFSVAYGQAPNISLTPRNAATAALTGTTAVFATSATGNFVITAGSAALTASTAYSWYYTAMQ